MINYIYFETVSKWKILFIIRFETVKCEFIEICIAVTKTSSYLENCANYNLLKIEDKRNEKIL